MTAEFDVYGEIREPAYDKWHKDRADTDITAKDGTPYKLIQELRREPYSPADPVLREVWSLTKESLRVFISGSLKTMEEGQGDRYTAGGDMGVDNQTEQMKADFAGT